MIELRKRDLTLQSTSKMKPEKNHFFAEKADVYDNQKSRTQNVENIGESILGTLHFSKKMHVLDFG